MASTTARGRVIGRGRGFGVPPRRPGENEDDSKSRNNKAAMESDLTSILNDLNEKTMAPASEALIQYISMKDPSSTRMKEVVDLLCQLAFKDTELVPVVVNVAANLCAVESFGSSFRGVLLKTIQAHYKNRESIRVKSTRQWIRLVSLICELFKQLRAGDAPLKPLAGAAHQTLSELLKEEIPSGDEEDEIDCFYHQFKSIGQLLETVDQGKLDELVGKVRDMILADSISTKTRCLLLELVELHACKWSMSPDLTSYYCDVLADIMSNTA